MKGNILIVDDHPGICLLLSEVFTQQSYTVKIATTGQEALDKISNHTFDLILLDNNLPIYDGMEVIRRLDRPDFSVPTVVMSGLPEKIEEKVSRFSFVKKVISKPFNIDDIQTLVTETLISSNKA